MSYRDGMHLTRREALRLGLLGACAWALPGAEPAAAGAATAPVAAPPARAAALIQIWLGGGPSHLDTFDPKPAAGRDWCGPFAQDLATPVDGLRLAPLLTRLAGQAPRFALLRGMSHGSDGHETATYISQTGAAPGGVQRPSAAALAAHLLGPARGPLPRHVALPRPPGRFDEAGFLGLAGRSFATGGDPNREPFLVDGIAAAGVPPERLRARRDLLAALDPAAAEDGPLRQALRAQREQAFDLILGEAGQAFDLAREGDAMRDAYGRTTFGQSCLLARRLVERGVRVVSINWSGWDTHKSHFQAMNRMLPILDQGLAALLGDLDQRGLLGSTIVWCGGEFGRTPRIQWQAPWNGGRGHHGKAFSHLVAGGGFAGGRVLGATDPRGESVIERPIHPGDLVATMLHLMGVHPDATLPRPGGAAVPASPLAGARPRPTAGILREVIA